MTNNEKICVQEFDGLMVPKSYLEHLANGVWLVNPEGLKELIVNYENDSKRIHFHTLSDVSGHRGMINETRYIEEPNLRNIDWDYVLFKRIYLIKFKEGDPGYFKHRETLINAGCDFGKVGGGFVSG